MVALGTGAATGDETPRFLAGEPSVSVNVRSTYSSDPGVPYGCDTPVHHLVYSSATRQVAAGPIAAGCTTESSTTGGCAAPCYARAGTWAIPEGFDGRYHVVSQAVVDGVVHTIAVKEIEVLGPTAGILP